MTARVRRGSRDRAVWELDSTAGGDWRELRVSAEASEMVTVPRAELDALRAEVRRLRREVGRSVARARMEADPGPGDAALTLSRSELAEAWGISE